MAQTKRERDRSGWSLIMHFSGITSQLVQCIFLLLSFNQHTHPIMCTSHATKNLEDSCRFPLILAAMVSLSDIEGAGFQTVPCKQELFYNSFLMSPYFDCRKEQSPSWIFLAKGSSMGIYILYISYIKH